MRMNRIGIVGICLFFLLAFLLTAGQAALAAASVTYEGGAEKFVFLPGGESSETSLFPGFLDLLPGDEIEQKIRVKNTSGKSVRLYLRVGSVDSADADFLNSLSMRVQAASGEIFDAPAGQREGLSANTLLGTLRDGGSTNLTVKLTVPAALGNAYMEKRGTVPWTFVAEEVEDMDEPETGDRFDVALWLFAAGVAAAALAVLLLTRNKGGKGFREAR
jgi:hypothetical protein